MQVNGATAIVTGGASGIGLGIAIALRAAGARVVVADLSLDAAQAAAATLDGLAVRVDVADEASVHNLVSSAVVWGGQVDILVNNAGVGPQAAIASMTAADWRWILDVNLWGVLHGIAAALPAMLERGSGHIVNVSSMSALAPMPPLGAYAVTKAGVSALSEVLRLEIADRGVGVTQVAPGPTRSNIADSLRHRADSGSLQPMHIDPPAELWRTADEVGRLVVEAIEADREWVITHPELWGRVEERYERLGAAFGKKLPHLT